MPITSRLIMAPPHLLLRLLAAGLASNFALTQALLAQITGRGVAISRPGVGFALSGRQPAGSRYEAVTPGTYAAPAGFDPPVNATVARAVLDAIEVRDPAVDESTRTVEVQRSDSYVSVPFLCASGQYGVLMWAPLYLVVWGHIVPGGESFEVWFAESNLPEGSSRAGEYRVDCFD